MPSYTDEEKQQLPKAIFFLKLNSKQDFLKLKLIIDDAFGPLIIRPLGI
jgi:hypothetical protein